MEAPTPSAARRPFPSFLVTSIGAYADSGIGTGGFVCVHDGAATVIDSIDSTGLCWREGVAYRFVRGLQTIVGYNEGGVCYQLKTELGLDVHDILATDEGFVCVATGTNEVLWLDPFGRVTRRWQADGKGDAWHLNCLWQDGNALFFSAFGRFAEHRGWLGKCTGTGMIFDLNSGADVVTGLNGPHNPRLIGGDWMVCDSHQSALVIQAQDGRKQRVELQGFTRGLAYNEEYLYVGESADRKKGSGSDQSTIARIERSTLEVVDRISIPFPEIYDILIVAPEFTARVTENLASFQLDQSTRRIDLLEQQVLLGQQREAVWRQRVEDLRVPAAFWDRLVMAKRKLLG